jgi:deoxyribodipyrimidine photo-lyase
LKFDPLGTYVRRWVPELAAVSDAYIHTPWEMPAEVQTQAGCRIGSDYPAPIVDHPMARERVLSAYRQSAKPAPPLELTPDD